MKVADIPWELLVSQTWAKYTHYLILASLQSSEESTTIIPFYKWEDWALKGVTR